jgi:iron complex transport system substrate-binding protein
MPRLALALTLLATPAFALDCPEGQRTFAHPRLVGGEACVPADPQRIAMVGEEGMIAHLLGRETVVRNLYFDLYTRMFPAAVAPEELAGMTDIGIPWEMDLEVLARAAPDLIVSGDWLGDTNDQMARIAPTVAIDYSQPGTTWWSVTSFVAQLLGEDERLAADLAAIDARLADFKGRLPDPAPTFAVLRITESPDTVDVFTALNIGAQLATQGGMVLHPAVRPVGGETTYSYPISTEALAEIDADWLVLIGGEDAAARAAFEASPLWQLLPAVQAGRVIRPEAPGRHWVTENMAFAHMIIDEVYAGVLGLAPAPTANPFAALRQE